jgi:GNAT superfamily N-acetyltransferase
VLTLAFAADPMARWVWRDPERPLIGVDPARQNEGHGSRLMRRALAAADRDARLAYLESANPRNVPFYERLGFERLGTIEAGSSPPMLPMLRKPSRRIRA